MPALICRFTLYLLLFVAVLASGCAVVQPWERGDLADYTMRPDRDPLGSLFAEHGGGGCGCN